MDKIGDEELIGLDAPPDFVKSRLELVVRPGVNGTGFFDIGSRGEPQVLRSRQSYADLPAAVDAFARYCAMIDGDPVSITYGDVDMTAYGTVHQVVGVRAIDLRRLGASSNGDYGWLEAEWTVVPVPVPAEE